MIDRLTPQSLALVVDNPPGIPSGGHPPVYSLKGTLVEVVRHLRKSTKGYSARVLYGSHAAGKTFIFPDHCLVPATAVQVADHGHEAVHKMVDAFLTDRREGDHNGWAPVEKGDIGHLHEVIDALVTAKWGPDADGDRPVEWALVDRTRYWPLTCEPVPYIDTFGAPTALRVMLTNLDRNTAPVHTQTHLIEEHLLGGDLTTDTKQVENT